MRERVIVAQIAHRIAFVDPTFLEYARLSHVWRLHLNLPLQRDFEAFGSDASRRIPLLVILHRHVRRDG